MSDSQIPIDYQINEAGLFSSFNERLQAIDSSLAWLMVKSLRRQGESVASKDGSKTSSSRSFLYPPSDFPQDTRMRSSSFSGRPTSRPSSSSSSSSAASMPPSFPPDTLHSSSSSLPPPPQDIHNSPLPPPSLALSDLHNSQFSESCRCAHEDAASPSPSVRAREDAHYHRYHTALHHYASPYPPQYESYDNPPPPPPLPPPSYFSPSPYPSSNNNNNPPVPPPLPPPTYFSTPPYSSTTSSPYPSTPPPPPPPPSTYFSPQSEPYFISPTTSHYPSFPLPASPSFPLFHHKVEEKQEKSEKGEIEREEKREKGRLGEAQMKAQEQVARLQILELQRKERERIEEEKRQKNKWTEGLTWQEVSYGDPGEGEDEGGEESNDEDKARVKERQLLKDQETEQLQEVQLQQLLQQQDTETMRELQIEDLAPPDINDDIQQLQKEKEEESQGESEEKNKENVEKQEKGKKEQTPLKTRPIRQVSKWIRAEESDDSNDDVVLPKDLPPPPISPAISPHQLTKPSPNSSEKLYQEFVSDLTNRVSVTSASILSSGRNKLRQSSSTSNLASSTAYPFTPSRPPASLPTSRPSSSSSTQSSKSSPAAYPPPPLTRSLPPTLTAPSPSLPPLPANLSSSTPIPHSDIQHMSRSLSNLEWRTALAHSAGVSSRPTRSRSDADEALLREELRVLRESLRSLERPHRAQEATQESHETTYASTATPPRVTSSRYADYDSHNEYAYRPGTGPTAARPPPSPASTRANLDDSLVEDVRHLTDNLRGLPNTTTQTSRSTSEYDSEDARAMRRSADFHDAHLRENAMRTSNIRLSDEAHDTRTHEGEYASHSTLASEHPNPARASRRRRNNSEGGLPLEEEANLDGSFVIPLSYNEYISVLAKRYQDKASHITKPSPNVSLPIPSSSSSKKVTPKKKRVSAEHKRAEWR